MSCECQIQVWKNIDSCTSSLATQRNLQDILRPVHRVTLLRGSIRLRMANILHLPDSTLHSLECHTLRLLRLVLRSRVKRRQDMANRQVLRTPGPQLPTLSHRPVMARLHQARARRLVTRRHRDSGPRLDSNPVSRCHLRRASRLLEEIHLFRPNRHPQIQRLDSRHCPMEQHRHRLRLKLGIRRRERMELRRLMGRGRKQYLLRLRCTSYMMMRNSAWKRSGRNFSGISTMTVGCSDLPSWSLD